jgi:NAD+ synthase
MAQHEAGAKEEQPHWTNRQGEVWGIFMQYHRANRHKMEPIPVCILPSELSTL